MSDVGTINVLVEEKAYTDKLFDSLKANFNLTNYEVELLKIIADDLKKPFPVTLNGVESRVNTMDSYRVKLLNIIQVVNDRLATLEYEYKKLYDPKFVQLTRAGRPNQQSVDSEIHMDISMQDKRLVLTNYDNFKSLLYGYLKSIDLVRDTILQKWRMGGF